MNLAHGYNLVKFLKRGPWIYQIHSGCKAQNILRLNMYY